MTRTKNAHQGYQPEMRNVQKHDEIVAQQLRIKAIAAILITVIAFGYSLGQQAQLDSVAQYRECDPRMVTL